MLVKAAYTSVDDRSEIRGRYCIHAGAPGIYRLQVKWFCDVFMYFFATVSHALGFFCVVPIHVTYSAAYSFSLTSDIPLSFSLSLFDAWTYSTRVLGMSCRPLNHLVLKRDELIYRQQNISLTYTV